MSEDGRPGEGGSQRRVSDDPKLALWVEDNGDGFEAGGSDGPAAGKDFDGVIVCAAAPEVDGEVQIAERWERRGCELGALFIEGELPGMVGDEAGGAAGAVGVVPGDLLGKEGVGGLEIGDGRGAQQGDEAVLEGARRSILPLACGSGATWWAMPRPSSARWNWERTSSGPVCGVVPKRERPSV